jgi:hypothetical protein
MSFTSRVTAFFFRRSAIDKVMKSETTSRTRSKTSKVNDREQPQDEPVLSSLSAHSTSSGDGSCTNNKNTTNISAPTETQMKLPYANVVLRPEEMKFHCQIRIMAYEVKYSMVTTVINSWEHDLKTIPNWDRIGGELLLRK